MGGELFFVGFIVGSLVYSGVVPIMKTKIREKEKAGSDAGSMRWAYEALDWISDVFTMRGERFDDEGKSVREKTTWS